MPLNYFSTKSHTLILYFRWYWKGKPANIGQLEECCAVHPMATHKYKQKWQIDSLDQQFYGPAGNKELTKLNERTRRYADKVRKAMGIDP